MRDLTLDDCAALCAEVGVDPQVLRAGLCVALGHALRYQFAARELADVAAGARIAADQSFEALDEVRGERDAALSELKTAEVMADALAASHAEASRLRDETIETLRCEIAALQQREAYVQQELSARADFVRVVEYERDSAITARNDARAEAEKAARECVEARLELGEMQRRVWAALGCNDEMVARAMMLSGARDEAVACAERAEHARDVNRNAWATACQERDRAVQEREDFGLRASAAVARAERAEKALADAAGVADRLGCRIVDLEAEVLCLQGERDRARAEIEEMRVELNSRVNEVNEARRLVRDLAEMTVSRDQLRDEAAMLRQRPTYEARETAPTRAERQAHSKAGGAWLVSYLYGREEMRSEVLRGWEGALQDGTTYIALGADRLPCAWPVASLVKP
jgi:hypothetical protein